MQMYRRAASCAPVQRSLIVDLILSIDCCFLRVSLLLSWSGQLGKYCDISCCSVCGIALCWQSQSKCWICISRYCFVMTKKTFCWFFVFGRICINVTFGLLVFFLSGRLQFLLFVVDPAVTSCRCFGFLFVDTLCIRCAFLYGDWIPPHSAQLC